MPRIPKSLQPPARPATVRQTQIIKQYGSLAAYQRVTETERIKKKVSDAKKSLGESPIEDYGKEYGKLDKETQQYFLSPSEFQKKLGENKAWQEYQAKKSYHAAYQSVLRHYHKGMLWAVAGYGTGLEKGIAQQMIKEGYSSAKGGLLDIERQKARSKAIKEAKDLGLIEIKGTRIIKIEKKIPIVTPQLELQKSKVKPTIILKEEHKPLGFKLPYETRGTTTGLTPEDIRPRVIEKEEPPPSKVYLGEKEISIITTPYVPRKETIMGMPKDYEIPKEEKRIFIKDISPEKTGIIRGVKTTYMPARTLHQAIYLPSKESAAEYNKLLEATKYGALSFAPEIYGAITKKEIPETGKPAGWDLDQFIKKQRAEYKKDIGRLNALKIKKDKLTSKEIESYNKLVHKINLGMSGRGWELVKAGAESYEREGKKIKVLGFETPHTIGGIGTPTIARTGLRYGVGAVEIEETVLTYQVGAAGFGALLGTTAVGTSILKGVAKVSKPLKYLTPPAGIALTGIAGYSEYQVSGGDIPYTIGAGLGTGMGFFAGVYSKGIVEGVPKTFKAIGKLGGKEIKTISGKKAELGGVWEKKSKYAQKQLLKYKKEQAKLSKSEVIHNLRFKKEGNIIRDKTFQEKLRDVRRLFNKLKDAPPNQRDELSRKLKSLLKDTYGKEYNKIIKEYASQELGYVALKREPSKYAGLGLYERTGEVVSPISKDLIAQGVFLGYRPAEKERLATEQLIAPISISKQKEELTTTPVDALISEQIPKQKGATAIAPASILISEQILEQPLISYQGITEKGIPRRPQEKPKIHVIPMAVPVWFPGEKKYKKKPQVGYHSFVKSKGKWKKVSTRPHTRQSAKSLGARITDNTTSAHFKIEPLMKTKIVKGKKKQIPKVFKQNELVSEDGYFKKAAHKFRDYVIHQGRKRPIKNRWIEKKNKRMDKKGETQGITLAQWKARQRKVTLGLPTRRVKKKSKRRPRFRI